MPGGKLVARTWVPGGNIFIGTWVPGDKASLTRVAPVVFSHVTLRTRLPGGKARTVRVTAGLDTDAAEGGLGVGAAAAP